MDGDAEKRDGYQQTKNENGKPSNPSHLVSAERTKRYIAWKHGMRDRTGQRIVLL
jgi:hypothetical protein